jgi:hypothetical protein
MCQKTVSISDYDDISTDLLSQLLPLPPHQLRRHLSSLTQFVLFFPLWYRMVTNT